MGMEIELLKKDYISRADLMQDLLQEWLRFFGEVDFLQIVQNQPSADVAKIVRCEHCQSYDHGYCPTLKTRMDHCDFCSYGKRGTNVKT